MAKSSNEPMRESSVLTRQDVEKPRMFRVLLHNDDYTTMDFVVSVLMEVFNKNMDDAVRIMLAVHNEGVGQCGVYTAEIAETKVAMVHSRARSAEFPLRCTMEAE